MKVRKRSYPLDTLSVEHKDYHVLITTHRSLILTQVTKGGGLRQSGEFTLEQFIAMLMGTNK